MTEPTIDTVLASVRSVITAVPAPRTAADEREHDGWQRAGRFEVLLEDVPALDGAR